MKRDKNGEKIISMDCKTPHQSDICGGFATQQSKRVNHVKISKKLVLKSLLIVLLLMVLLPGCAKYAKDAELPTADSRPNFLLVVADDMAYTDLGSFGGEIDTPNVDLLVAEGVRFTDFHVSVSCSPTRSMLMSGTDNHLAGLGTMSELIQPWHRGKPGYEGYLNNRVVSLAEIFRDGGYHTYMAGKWHLGHAQDQLPYDRGFERTFSLMNGGASHWNDMSPLFGSDVVRYTKNGQFLKSLPGDFYSSRSYADFLMDSIRENLGDGHPFLAYLAFAAPHDPIHAPEPWRSKYKGQYAEGYEALRRKRIKGSKQAGVVPSDVAVQQRHVLTKPWSSLTEEEKAWQQRQMEVYAGMVDNLDYHLGRVVQFLRDIGEYDNTVIIFFSDNGSNPWDSEDYPGNRESDYLKQFDNTVDNIGNRTSHSAYGIGWAQAGSGPLDLFKFAVGEGGIRSPLIVTGPGIKGGGRINRSFSYVADIMPTMLELAGLQHPEQFEGQDVLPMRGHSMVGLLNDSKKSIYSADEYVGGEMFGGRWLRKGDYKAILVPKPYGDGQWRLYNVVMDPGETNDLAKEKPNLLQELQQAWDHYADEVGVVLPD
jgi:arylsulfatase